MGLASLKKIKKSGLRNQALILTGHGSIALVPAVFRMLSYLDDLIILPLGILLILNTIPSEVMRDWRSQVGKARVAYQRL